MDENSWKYFDLWRFVENFGEKLLRIMLDKVDWFVRDYDRTKFLVLFDPEKYGAIFDRFRYLILLKCAISYVASYNYAKIKIDLDGDLPLEKALSLHNVIIVKSVFDKNHNQYFYKTFLEKCSYQLAKN